MNFSALETRKSGKAKNSKSNRAGSYANYLIRLIIFYQETHPDEYSTFTTYRDFIKLKTTILNSDFPDYNELESRFPNAALNSFERFIQFRIKDKNENQVELNYNADQTNFDEDSSPYIVKEDTVPYKIPRKPIKNYDNHDFYPRNLNESKLAKQRSHWKCENDISHITFKSESDNNQYMESHHLIPMSYQGLFHYSIDFADNIICLCPICHRKIHFATDDVKSVMIQRFYNHRKNLYPKYGIEIDFRNLLEMYNIKKDPF